MFSGNFLPRCREQKIRKYLIENNFIESIISLPANLFYGTSIAVNILVLSRNKTDTKTQFIDASLLFKKQTNNNILDDEHIEKILQIFKNKEETKHFSRCVSVDEIKNNDFNLSVSSYIEAKDLKEVIDIDKLNEELEQIVKKEEILRSSINEIITNLKA